ncbi:MAG: hypothetical protein OES24_14850 [Acidimicrobiia bacterium]|nr:hypothetical protein [Acidimicrobiia bacterium]
MITALRWLLAILYRRFRWVALGAALRTLTRRSTTRSIDDATDELAQRLPDPVVRAIDAAPGDLLRIGGGAVAAGRAARAASDRSRRVGLATRRIRRRWSDPGGVASGIREQWRRESELSERELWAEYHRAQGDHTAADDALLDRRHRHHDAPLPPVPEPVPPGRPRVRRRAATAVNRVQRTYRRASKPWDH